MSAPGIGKHPHISLPDWSTVENLPKPVKALVYVLLLAVGTVVAIGALLTTIAIIGQLTGAFSILSFFA